MSHKPKNRPLGPAFHGYLRQCEKLESFMLSGVKELAISHDIFGDFVPFLMESKQNSKDFLFAPKKMSEVINSLIARWAHDATVVRESFKFQACFQTLVDTAPAEEWQVSPTLLPLGRAPFDHCMFMVRDCPAMVTEVLLDQILEEFDSPAELTPNEVIKHYNDKLQWTDVSLLIEADRIMTPVDDQPGGLWDRTTTDDWYEEFMKPGDKFTSITMYLHSDDPEQPIGLIPMETHHLNDDPYNWVTAYTHPALHEHGLWRFWAKLQCTLYLMFLCALQSPVRCDTVTQGRRPGLPIRKHKRHERLFYEHTTVTIDPLFVPPERNGESLPYTPHRQHPVRGFIRHYKQPLKSGPFKGKTWTWVHPHHRGDKDLGVISHDYVIEHEDERP